MILAVLGPTAVGKTDLLHNLLPKVLAPNKIEIINCDSTQVYRGLNIGVAKPSLEQQRDLRYHLLDIFNPNESFSVGLFIKMATIKIHEILMRGNIPVLSGGTAFYIKHFLYGLPDIPSVPSDVYEKLKEEYAYSGWDPLFSELKEKDPLRSQTLNLNDSYRLIRALAVIRHTGLSFSSFNEVSEIRSSLAECGGLFFIGLERERSVLYERINARVLSMFEQGLEKEIASLLCSGITYEMPAMRAIGYQEMVSSKYKDLSREEKISTIQKNSRRYAKRQLTFFRKIEPIHWFHPDNVSAMSLSIMKFLEKEYEAI